MAILRKKSNSQVLLSDLKIANDFILRMKGLLGTKELADSQGLWIKHCNSIHTFFMQYEIDCIFLSSDLRVKAIKENIKPGKIVWPQFGATSVVEMKSGQARKMNLSIGEELHVGN